MAVWGRGRGEEGEGREPGPGPGLGAAFKEFLAGVGEEVREQSGRRRNTLAPHN